MILPQGGSEASLLAEVSLYRKTRFAKYGRNIKT
ncbi:hypothetical protein CN360_16610 [Bacillus cereus]|nr:hypothetical protein COM98_15775 [Bacillus cereus]PEW34940.1 hypothetical protein CN441_05785 [Bacillus cereus]PEY92279.1 hypothetical protein CN360_16610 [Bacillus cereus]PGE46754.1 hypothetical protein COM63_16635 [Bacillus cereus]PGR35993.1 hypothetical protein COC64_13170 [Bacillus cereus]